jgi:hypothetical protein
MREIKAPEKITYYQNGKWYEQRRADYEDTQIAREQGVAILCSEIVDRYPTAEE